MWVTGALQISIRQARTQDAEAVGQVMSEAALWLESKRMPLWKQEEISREHVLAGIAAGSFFLAFWANDAAGTVWPSKHL
jgi:hypothetical protein